MNIVSFETLVEHVRWDESGLVAVVVQNAYTGQVLTVAYANEQAVRQTWEQRQSIFWSRSRKEIWHKGATSGHVQHIVSISLDCDGDALVYHVVPQGPACHTGAVTCFFRSTEETAITGVIWDNLIQTIAQRDEQRSEGSYTAYLLEKGIDKICKKIGEESAEVIIAAKNRNPEELVSEVSDLLFHVLVLLREQGVSWQAVMQKVQQRQIVSSIRENPSVQVN